MLGQRRPLIAGIQGDWPGGLRPYAWFDASDGATLFDEVAGGNDNVGEFDPVARWEDKSGNGRHATRSAGAERPTRLVNIKNGLGVLEFDGSDDSLSAFSVDLAGDEITLFVVCYATSLTNFQSVVRFQQGSGVYYVASWSGSRFVISSVDGGTSGISNGAVQSQWNILTSSRVRNEANGLKTWRNGTFVASRSTTDNPLPSCYMDIGRHVADSSEPFSGYIGEIIMYKTALNDTDREAVEAYLFDKWMEPTDIADIRVWYDGADASTMYDATTGGSLVAADGAIARWEDKSGGSRHAIQATPDQRPLRKTGVKNGLNVVRFDGTDDSLAAVNGTLSGDEVTIFLVSYATSLTNYRSAVRFQNASTPYLVFPWGNTSQRLMIASNDGGTAGISTGLVAGEWGVAAGMRIRNLGDGMRTWYNGTSVATRSTTDTALPTTYIVIGRYAVNLSEMFSGDIAEIIVYLRALPDHEREAVERYLINKWDL